MLQWSAPHIFCTYSLTVMSCIVLMVKRLCKLYYRHNTCGSILIYDLYVRWNKHVLRRSSVVKLIYPSLDKDTQCYICAIHRAIKQYTTLNIYEVIMMYDRKTITNVATKLGKNYMQNIHYH
jgi:hypothetical protein